MRDPTRALIEGFTAKLAIATVVIGASGCLGTIGDPGATNTPKGTTGPTGTVPPGTLPPGTMPPVMLPPTSTATLMRCDPSAYAGITLDTILAEYATHVHPNQLDPTDGCMGCHAAGSGRMLIIGTDAAETFYRIRTAGMLDDKPGAIEARLLSADPMTRMPRDHQPWSIEKINHVIQVVCANGVYTSAAAAAVDEQFPPDLLTPYAGPPITDTYDNTFINFYQLKGKVLSVFDDDWMRAGVDQFETNIALFGGVDFGEHFLEARGATSDFLLGLDGLSKDICSRAATSVAGPFSGLDLHTSLIDAPPSVTKRYEAENTADMTPSTGGREGTLYDLYANGTLTTKDAYNFPGDGSYTFTIHARGTPADSAGPDMDLVIGGQVRHTFTNIGTTLQDYVYTGTVAGGAAAVALAFTNDDVDAAGNDRNLLIDYLVIDGPAGAGTGTTRINLAKSTINTLYTRILFRPAIAAEQDDAYQLLLDLSSYRLTLTDTWSGLCEALVRHPDFLFTLPPARATATGADRDRLLLVKVAQDLVARPPSSAEFAALASGAKTVAQTIDDYLASTEFRDYIFYKMRIRTESDGTPEADEPARLWTRLLMTGDSFEELLNGDYGVDASYQKTVRGPEHGNTGVLTMTGYIKHKPGLPHFNYAARVLSDFMGYVFEVPPEVIAQRINATAATTVDPSSICFTCHKLLTPLAHQRLAWTDDGVYRTTDDSGAPIDDSDRNLVADYPFKGKGLEAFSTKAVKKERFIRHTLDAEYQLLFGRPMRYDQDERVIYKQLWDVVQNSHGDLRATFKTMMASPAYQGP